MYFDVIFGEGERNRIQIHSVRTRLKGRKRHGLGEFNFVFIRLTGMPVASGDYWNNGFGREKGEIEKDEEGLRNAAVVARRMTFLMRAIADAKVKYPELTENEEERVWTHFIK